jgi:hypothetical protein
MKDKRNYITASEIGTFVFCPEAWRLSRFGGAVDSPEMLAGSTAHVRWERADVLTEWAARFMVIALVIIFLGYALQWILQ